MILLIDAFNLIYKFPDLEIFMYENNLLDARRGLLNLLKDYSRKRKHDKIHIFFDGKKEQGSMVVEDEIDEMRIYYSHDVKADDCIKLFIQKSLSQSEVYLVTSDKDLLHHSKKFGCKSFKSEEFAKFLEETISQTPVVEEKDSQVRLTRDEVNYWYGLFKGNKNAGKKTGR